jgi:L-ascorbate metabolism protein UlaG (beta-lactamase superfamily)
VLLRIGGLTILTDPVFSTRVGLGLGLLTGGPRRIWAPTLNLSQLPKLDLIVISHAHFDHLDRPTLVRLPKRTPVVTADGTRDLIDDLGYRDVTELRWGQSKRFGDVLVTAREVKHWGARTFYDQHRGFNAYVLDDGKHRVLYGGDTAYQEHFSDLPAVDLAVLGIGAYDPYIAAHATPEQAWVMAGHARAAHVLPVHHSTFQLSREHVDEPLERLFDIASNRASRIVAHRMGTLWTPFTP